ncbi:hypothetical protein ACGFY9_14035 [Streptomyces sp. NPDC048504]|uniref:hypothetical protein n=1 Tax=Streptomyces sp. NPDC048504 TaxID=3365559 RepID=UPI00371997BA
MTPSLRTARTCTTATILLTAFALYSATISYWLALPGLYAATVLWCCANRARADHRRILARHGQVQRAAAGPAELPPPCCQFWTHSNGVVHGPDCTRPPLARRDRYRLSAHDEAVFQQLAARIDLSGPNDRSSAA